MSGSTPPPPASFVPAAGPGDQRPARSAAWKSHHADTPPSEAAAGAVEPEQYPASPAVAGATFAPAAPATASAGAGAAAEAAVPPDSLAAAIFDPTGLPPPLPNGGQPLVLAAKAPGDAAGPPGKGGQGGFAQLPPAEPPARPSQLPSVLDDTKGQPTPPITLVPTPDDPLPTVVTGGERGKAEGGKAAPYAGGHAGRSRHGSSPWPESAEDQQYVMPADEGGYGLVVTAVPEPTIAITLLACLPILLRRRGRN